MQHTNIPIKNVDADDDNDDGSLFFPFLFIIIYFIFYRITKRYRRKRYFSICLLNFPKYIKN